MGVTGMWEYMQKFAESVPLADLAKKKLAIDGTAWIVELHKKGCASRGQTKDKSLTLAFFQRTCRLMECAVEPVFVFDTAKTIDFESSRAPARRSNGRRSKKGDSNNRLMLLKELDDVKALLEKMDLRYVDAACDSIAQCAQLEMDSLVAGCIARDMNYFLFGGRNMYVVDFGSSFVGTPEKIQLFSMDMISATQGLNRNRLIALAILLGCDSYERGIQRVGVVTGLEIIAEFSIIDDDHPQTILDRFRSYASDELGSWHEDSEMKEKLFKANFHFPNCFPNSETIGEAINAYLLPSVNTVEADVINGSLADPPGHVKKQLEDHLGNLFKWEAKRASRDMDQVYKKRQSVLSESSQESSQKKIEKYFTPSTTTTSSPASPVSTSRSTAGDSAVELAESITSNASSNPSRYRPLVCDKSVSEDEGILCSKREFTALEALKIKMSLYTSSPLIVEASLRSASLSLEDDSPPSSIDSRRGLGRRRPAEDTMDSSPAPKRIARDEMTTTIEATSQQPSIIIESYRAGKQKAAC